MSIMINYDYICDNCGHELSNVLQSIKDDPLTHCDECGEETLSRGISVGLDLALFSFAFVSISDFL